MNQKSLPSCPLIKLPALVTLVTCIAGSFFAPSATAQQAQFSHGDPTALEQQMLEVVNRARMNPAAEGGILNAVNTWYSADARSRKPSFFANLVGEFAAYPAVPPLAFNAKLLQAARAHSQDMVARSFFAHVNPSGQDPTARGAAAGYDAGVGENIDGGGASTGDDILMSHFSFMVDYDNIDTTNPIGHRQNVLNSTYSEVGIGIYGARYGGKLTQNFGAPARSYILGVAYADTNANGAYDAGEGMGGIYVKPDTGNWYAVTSTSGGFAIPVDPVQTVSDTVNVPFAVQGNTWAAIQPYDAAYRQQQLAAAPTMTMNLTWSGGALSAPRTSTVTMKRPVQRNYRIMGTDGWFYSMSMVTSQNAKADLTSAIPAVVPRAGIAKDFNGDGKPDLVFQNSSGQIAAWYMNGSGSMTSSAMLYSAGLGDWKVVATADMNGDGNADLIFQNTAGQIVVWYMSSTGIRSGFAVIYNGTLGDWKVKAAADMNGDGNADLVFQNGSGQIAVWYLNGAGVATSSAMLYSGGLGDWKLAGIADMNSDGTPDLVFQNGPGQIAVWYMNGGGYVSGSAVIYGGGLGDWKIAGIADMNNDGKPDLIFQNNIGQIAVWYMNGLGGTAGNGYLYSAGLGDWRLR